MDALQCGTTLHEKKKLGFDASPHHLRREGEGLVQDGPTRLARVQACRGAERLLPVPCNVYRRRGYSRPGGATTPAGGTGGGAVLARKLCWTGPRASRHTCRRARCEAPVVTHARRVKIVTKEENNQAKHEPTLRANISPGTISACGLSGDGGDLEGDGLPSEGLDENLQ